MTTELPEKPLSRKESYLAKIAGEAVEIPEKPESRIEQYLAYIAENGGGGGGGIPTTVIDTIWFGTQDQYDAIVTKADKTLYLVQEDVETPVSLSLNSPRNVETVIERPVVVPNFGLKNTIASDIEDEEENSIEEEPEEEASEDTPEEPTEEKE